MQNNLEICIPADVIVELQNGIDDGSVANQWWQSLTKDQQKFMLEAGFIFLQKQKIKESQLQSELLIPTLIELSKSAGSLELYQDDDNRFLLSGKIERNLYGIRGRCYSQFPEFIGTVCEEFLGGYVEASTAHKHGQHTVDVICFALNVLPGVTASKTPANSIADVGLRWDVIIKWNDDYFPIQVKSSLQGVEKALETGSLGNYAQQSIENLGSKYYQMEENFVKKTSKYSQEERENKKAYYKSRQENISELMRKYGQTTPLYIWASQNRQTILLLVELFANSFKIENNLKQYQDQAVAAYLEKYPDMIELRRQKIHKLNITINAKKKEQAEQVIQVLKEQIQGKQKRIRNRKARKRPVVIEHTQALKLVEDALKRIQDIMEGETKLQWYRDGLLFDKIEKLRDIDKETNSPMFQQTQELFTLIQDFTGIAELDFDLI